MNMIAGNVYPSSIHDECSDQAKDVDEISVQSTSQNVKRKRRSKKGRVAVFDQANYYQDLMKMQQAQQYWPHLYFQHQYVQPQQQINSSIMPDLQTVDRTYVPKYIDIFDRNLCR